jgi:hypothetical protein
LWAFSVINDGTLAVPQPKWWDELPLLPFLKICNYLEYKQVFSCMPRVCKHFNNLLTGYEVELEEICLWQPSEKLLSKLKDKVSVCKSLEIDDFSSSSGISKFLSKFEHSVVELNCVTFNEEEAKVITSFVNGCTSLRSLSVQREIWGLSPTDYDWSLHTVCATLEELDFAYSYAPTQNATMIFFKFPQLKRLTLPSGGFPVNESNNHSVIDIQNIARIEYYESDDLPPRVEFVCEVKEMVLYCRSHHVISMLIRYLPQLNALEKLHFDYNSIDYTQQHQHLPDEMEQYLVQLIQAVSANPTSLAKLKISARNGKDYDLGILKLLARLPRRITFVEYKGLKLRCPLVDGQETDF